MIDWLLSSCTFVIQQVLHTIVLPHHHQHQHHHHHRLSSGFVWCCCVIAVVYLYFEQISFILFRNSCHFFSRFCVCVCVCVHTRKKSLFHSWQRCGFMNFFYSYLHTQCMYLYSGTFINSTDSNTFKIVCALRTLSISSRRSYSLTHWNADKLPFQCVWCKPKCCDWLW